MSSQIKSSQVQSSSGKSSQAKSSQVNPSQRLSSQVKSSQDMSIQVESCKIESNYFGNTLALLRNYFGTTLASILHLGCARFSTSEKFLYLAFIRYLSRSTRTLVLFFLALSFLLPDLYCLILLGVIFFSSSSGGALYLKF